VTTLHTRNGWLLPTPFGVFELEHLRPLRDLPLLHAWMNDPEVAEYWELDGPRERVDRHVAEQLGSQHSSPYLGRLDGAAMSYWEIYRADLDPLAGHYQARPHDTGIHLLIGPGGHRGRGMGSALIRAVTEWTLSRSFWATRVVAEPDVRNTRSIRAFGNAGFVRCGVLDLPEKQAMLMVYDRNHLGFNMRCPEQTRKAS
jgi:acetyl CoA:N6-hydroxylysine acetyl transferase